MEFEGNTNDEYAQRGAEMIRITYTTEICKLYVDGIRKCKTREELEKYVNSKWEELASDALERIKSPEFDWLQYKKGLAIEKRGEYSGGEWLEKYGAILLPAVIMFIGLKAQHFHAPDGLVFMRACEAGYLKKNEDGIYYLDLPKEEKK